MILFRFQVEAGATATNITVTLGGVTETITIAADSYANTNAGVATQVKAELDALIAAGTLSNISITDNGAVF